MARKPPKLTVRYHRRAIIALQQIWKWNANEHTPEHAEAYVKFLKTNVDRLATSYMEGRPIPTRPQFQFTTIKRCTSGYGHVAIYRVRGETV
jgi:plasmid stabilization system protein ParE